MCHSKLTIVSEEDGKRDRTVPIGKVSREIELKLGRSQVAITAHLSSF